MGHIIENQALCKCVPTHMHLKLFPMADTKLRKTFISLTLTNSIYQWNFLAQLGNIVGIFAQLTISVPNTYALVVLVKLYDKFQFFQKYL